VHRPKQLPEYSWKKTECVKLHADCNIFKYPLIRMSEQLRGGAVEFHVWPHSSNHEKGKLGSHKCYTRVSSLCSEITFPCFHSKVYYMALFDFSRDPITTWFKKWPRNMLTFIIIWTGWHETVHCTHQLCKKFQNKIWGYNFCATKQNIHLSFRIPSSSTRVEWKVISLF
jgi:hypothetical protein